MLVPIFSKNLKTTSAIKTPFNTQISSELLNHEILREDATDFQTRKLLFLIVLLKKFVPCWTHDKTYTWISYLRLLKLHFTIIQQHYDVLNQHIYAEIFFSSHRVMMIHCDLGANVLRVTSCCSLFHPSRSCHCFVSWLKMEINWKIVQICKRKLQFYWKSEKIDLMCSGNLLPPWWK